MAGVTKLETVTVSGVEILATGTWNGDRYDTGDLDDIVAAYEAGNAGIDPPVKLGHGEDQTILNNSGLPAAGYVAALRREGTKLLADLRDVPRKVADLINAKAYSKVSSEVWFNLKHKGKRLPRVLKGIALLGADVPAVSSLADIEALYGADLATVQAHYSEAAEPDGDTDAGGAECTLRRYELPADMSVSDLHELLSHALRERFGGGGPAYNLFTTDVYPDRVVYCAPNGRYYEIGYTVADGVVTLEDGPPLEVRRVTTWRPVARPGGGVDVAGYAAGGDGAGSEDEDEEDEEEDYAETLRTFLERLDARMKGKRGMPAVRAFVSEALTKVTAMRSRARGYGQMETDGDRGSTKEELTMNPEIMKALGLAEDADEAAVLARIAELNARPEKATVSEYSADEFRALQNQVGTLTATLLERDASAAVEDAIRQGKVVPAQRAWAIGYATKDLDGFRAYVAAAPAFPLGTAGKPGGDTEQEPVTVTEAERQVARLLGVEEEKLVASKERQLARTRA